MRRDAPDRAGAFACRQRTLRLALAEGAFGSGATDFLWGPTGDTLVWNEAAPGPEGRRRTARYSLREKRVVERWAGEVVGHSRDRSTLVLLEGGRFRSVEVR